MITESIKVLELSDKDLYDSYAAFHPEHYGIDIDFCAIYEWGVFDQVLLVNRGDYITTVRKYGDTQTYFPPFVRPGVDYDWAVSDILSKDPGSVIHIMPNYFINRINKDKYDILDARQDYDYIYSSQELIELAGKKFHSKRNHINSFESKYEFIFRDYTAADYAQVTELYSEWQALQQNIVDTRYERSAFFTALDAINELDYKCGVIEIEGKVRAVSLVSISKANNMGQVHFEKGDRNYEGIYAAINNYCAKKYLSGCEYINRQDDLGLEGLRKAKLSYNPVRMIEKSMVSLK